MFKLFERMINQHLNIQVDTTSPYNLDQLIIEKKINKFSIVSLLKKQNDNILFEKNLLT